VELVLAQLPERVVGHDRIVVRTDRAAAIERPTEAALNLMFVRPVRSPASRGRPGTLRRPRDGGS
jgi:hypothetical protein